MFTLKIDTENDAFQQDKSFECNRILEEVMFKLQDGYDEGIIHDINGNRVGKWELT